MARVEAARLRAKLREHYETEGRDSRILIELPKRAYIPQFRLVETAPVTNRRRSVRSKTLIVGLFVTLAITATLVVWL